MLVRKIQTWRHLRKHELSFEEGVSFIRSEPHWPLRPETIPMLEKNITPKTSKKVIREWFVGHSPTTAHGMDAFMKTLGPHEQKHHQFVSILRTFWLSDLMTPHEQAALLQKYGHLLSPKDHQQRLEMLLWKRKPEIASALLGRIDVTKRATYQEWINVIHRKSRISATTHPGISTLLANNALSGNNPALAAKHLSGIDSKRVFILSESFFKTLIRTVRELMDIHHYSGALRLAEQGLTLSPTNPSHMAELHWMCGWLQTAYLNQPQKGFHHLVAASSFAKASADRAQFAYWAGKSAKAGGKILAAQQWFGNAAQFPHTFYGQLAAKELKHAVQLRSPNFHEDEIRHFASRDIVKAIQFLHVAEEHMVKNVLLDALHETLKTGVEYGLGFYFTQQYSTPYYTIHYYEKVNKIYNLVTPDVFLRIDFYPEGFENTNFIHAMAFNESRFHPMIKSDMGALGLMQITPLTGRHLASKGHAFDESRLYNDPAYNLKMGSLYLHELFHRFHQSYLLLAAAYNAGPTCLSKWLDRMGHPKHDYDYEWIERISYKETRDYVKKLLGMMSLYKQYSHHMRMYTPEELMEAYVKGCAK